MLSAEWKQYLGNTYYFSKLFIDGKLFYLEVAPNGLYKVFRLRNPSPHLSPANANPMYIASGMKANLEEAKERALKALEDYLKGTTEKVEKPVKAKKNTSKPVEEIVESVEPSVEEASLEEIPEKTIENVVVEEVVEDSTVPEPVLEVNELAEEPQEEKILEIEPAIKIEVDYSTEEPTVTLIPSLADMRIKYTANGRELTNKSRVYKEPFTTALGSIIKAGIEQDGKIVQLAEQEVKINEN